MTLVLSALAGGFAFQVSDRRVTREISMGGVGGSQVFDALANKNAVFRTVDALVSVGYSGHAFLGGVNTDTWLARKLSGVQDLPEVGNLIFLPDRPASGRRLYFGVQSLRVELESAFSQLSGRDRRVHQRVVIVGWLQLRRDRGIPLLWTLQNSADSPGRFVLNDELELHRVTRRLRLVATGRYQKGHVDWIHQQFEVRGPTKVREVEDILVEAVRQRAQEDEGIGSDCMCIRVTPSPTPLRPETPQIGPHVVIRYEPRVRAVATIRDQERDVLIPAAYSPWILLPHHASAPSLVSAARPNLLGADGVFWQFETPQAGRPPDLLGSMDPYRRRPFPGPRTQ